MADLRTRQGRGVTGARIAVPGPHRRRAGAVHCQPAARARRDHRGQFTGEGRCTVDTIGETPSFLEPADLDSSEAESDASLTASVRQGNVEAYGQLYERHVASAHNLASQLSRSRIEADDLVAEAFVKVLDALMLGRGPDSAFRAYLLTTLRHTAYAKTRRDRLIHLTDDVSATSSVSMAAVSVPFVDTAVTALDQSMAARAYATLPRRWQVVLWHTEIQGRALHEVAPLIGRTANAVSALAYRAREGLRQAYVQRHLTQPVECCCRPTVKHLGAWIRHTLSARDAARVAAHLGRCVQCRARAHELAAINPRNRRDTDERGRSEAA